MENYLILSAFGGGMVLGLAFALILMYNSLEGMFIEGYLKGVIDYSKGDLSFIKDLPETTKKKYDIKIKD